MIIGSANPGSTRLFLEKFDIPVRRTPWFYTSPIAIGTHLGDMTEKDSTLYRQAIEYGLNSGINFIDTAINYRGMRSERDIGFVLNNMMNEHRINREEIVISTKAGIIPGDIEANLIPDNYLKEVLLKKGIILESDLNMVDHQRHVLNPSYYQFAINESRTNLNLSSIDIYYIHNPEISMIVIGPDQFYKQLELLFSFLEEQVQIGNLRFYGLATWDGLIYNPKQPGYISLEKVIQTAKNAGGDNHNFRFIQLPYNTNLPLGGIKKNQKVRQTWLTVFEAAEQLDIFVTTSAPFNLGKAISDGKSPSNILRGVVQTKGILSTMVGMKRVQNVKSNVKTIQSLSS